MICFLNLFLISRFPFCFSLADFYLTDWLCPIDFPCRIDFAAYILVVVLNFSCFVYSKVGSRGLIRFWFIFTGGRGETLLWRWWYILSIYNVWLFFFVKLVIIGVQCVNEWFSSRGNFALEGTFVNVWGHFWLWELGGRGPKGIWLVEARDTALHRQCIRQSSQQRIIWPKHQ